MQWKFVRNDEIVQNSEDVNTVSSFAKLTHWRIVLYILSSSIDRKIRYICYVCTLVNHWSAYIFGIDSNKWIIKWIFLFERWNEWTVLFSSSSYYSYYCCYYYYYYYYYYNHYYCCCYYCYYLQLPLPPPLLLPLLPLQSAITITSTTTYTTTSSITTKTTITTTKNTTTTRPTTIITATATTTTFTKDKQLGEMFQGTVLISSTLKHYCMIHEWKSRKFCFEPTSKRQARD